MAEPIDRREYEAHQKTCDERFGRDKERLEKSEQIIDELKTVSVKMGTLIEQHNHKLEDHDERIFKLEEKPAKRWESVVGRIIEHVISFGFGALLVWLGLKDKM